MESENQGKSISLPGEWALKKAFGPVLEELGDDLRQLYAVGRDKIIIAGYKKIRNTADGKTANLRVTRDVFWNGAFTDDEVCAEYFGGVFASSRSNDGKDDSAIQFVDTIKSMSSKQLRLHYFIYYCLNKNFFKKRESVNVAQGSDIQSRNIFLAHGELDNLGIKIDTDFNVLFRLGLIHEYKLDRHAVGQRILHYASARPTTYGVLLYAAAHNRLEDWRSFDQQEFGEFDYLNPPKFFASTLNGLAKQAGMEDVEGN